MAADGGRPLRIAQLVPSLVLGGAEVMATSLAQGLLDAGHDVTLLTLRGGGPLTDRLSPGLRARLVEVPRARRFDLAVPARVARALSGVDVLHAHLFTGLLWGTAGAALARVPVVYTEHACHPDDEALVPTARRLLSRRVARVIACSEATAAAIDRHRWFPFAPKVTLPNGVDVRGRPQAVPGVGLHLGTVGRLVPVKGQRHLIDAVALLRDRGVRATLTIWGDGELRPALEAQIGALGLADQVTLAGPTDRVADALATLDLFVLPSLSEAMPMTLLEAGAAGLPLLVTTGGGGPTLLQAGAGGEAVPPGDPVALADAIARFAVRSPADRRALSEASRATVAARFSLEATVEDHVALYRAVIAEGAGGRSAR